MTNAQLNDSEEPVASILTTDKETLLKLISEQKNGTSKVDLKSLKFSKPTENGIKSGEYGMPIMIDI